MIPNSLYRVSASLKCKDVEEGRGAVLFLEQDGLDTSYDKFIFFLNALSKTAGEDVIKTTYTPEELELIRKSLEN